MLKATLKGAKQLKKALKAQSKRQRKALETAIKVEGYRLRRELKKEIRSGSPGGKKFEPLTFLARRKRGSKRFKPNKPLSRLALPIMYHVKSKDPFKMAIGWTGPRVSNSWKKIAERQQEGFAAPVTDPQESFFRHRGAEISRRSRNRRYFFLKDSTRQLDIPAREIIDPFYDAHHMESWVNIRKNFKRKLRGERI
jgi:hypothetical protein